MLSPQSTTLGQVKSCNNTYCKYISNTTKAHAITLFWNYGSNKLDAPLGYHDNVDTFKLAPGYQKFQAFESVIKFHTTQVPLISESTVVSDDEDDQDENLPPT